jgi:hypothetical protein
MQKASVDRMMKSVISMWEQSGTFFERATWLPEEGRKAYRHWVDFNKNACENLRIVMEEGYSCMEVFA